jgi:branched-chain amino acid transport system ATP-binding protein
VQEVIAMDFGEIIAVGTPAAIVRDPRVVEAYIGTSEQAALATAGGENGAA